MSRATTLLNRSRTRPLCLCSPCLLRCAPVSRVAKGPSRPWNGARGFQCTSRRPDQRAGGGAHEQPLASLRKAASSTDAAHDILSDVAFAFDIDGVLCQGGQGVPGAREMLTRISSEGVRYVFLTNGGGEHEDAKAASLLKRLQFPKEDYDVVRNRVILSHTPMRGWADSVKEKETVLITGSHPEEARKIAEEYGFARVVTPADIITANPAIYPFQHLRESLHSSSRELPDGKKALNLADPYSGEIPPGALKIDQIFLWNDPRDWSLDIQLIYDLLTSREGYLGTQSPKNGDASLPNNGWQQDKQPQLWVSNMDLLWKTEYPINRFGTGAFVAALKGVWAAATGGAQLRYSALGKPSKFTYEYTHGRLLRYHAGTTAGTTQQQQQQQKQQKQRRSGRLRRVYMIGDNPESDIRGANEFKPEDGTEWVSILVRTGVWRQSAAEREPKHRPSAIVDDVVDGVVWALRREGLDVDRQWALSGGK